MRWDFPFLQPPVEHFSNATDSFQFKAEPQLVCCAFIYVSVDRPCLLPSLTTHQDTPGVTDLPFLQSSIVIVFGVRRKQAHIRDTTYTTQQPLICAQTHTHKEVCLLDNHHKTCTSIIIKF